MLGETTPRSKTPRRPIMDREEVSEELRDKLQELVDQYNSLMHDETEVWIEIFMLASEHLPDDDIGEEDIDVG